MLTMRFPEGLISPNTTKYWFGAKLSQCCLAMPSLNNEQGELIIVYNADSSLFAQVTDYLHKTISPHNYQCNLCTLTHNQLGMKQEWKRFLQSLPYSLTFLHRDEFKSLYPDYANEPLPAIFKKLDTLQLLIDAENLNSVHSLSMLKQLLQSKLSSKEST